MELPITQTVEAQVRAEHIVRSVDARGQSCPGPLVTLARELKEVRAGELVELLATDPGSWSDVPAWARLTGNELLERAKGDDGVFRYRIRKV